MTPAVIQAAWRLGGASALPGRRGCFLQPTAALSVHKSFIRYAFITSLAFECTVRFIEQKQIDPYIDTAKKCAGQKVPDSKKSGGRATLLDRTPRWCETCGMATFSFDIVSDYDKAELNNVFDQTQRELNNRYDFKGTPAAVEWLDAEKTGLKISGSGDWQIEAIVDIVRKKLAARNQSQKLLDTSREPTESNLKMTKEVPFKKGLDQEKAKKITAKIRESFPKVKPQIQGDEVRVSSGSKDELQAVMQLLREADFDFPLQFVNFR